jgi:hypothetical protein
MPFDLPRRIEAEMLDQLAIDDPRARAARGDMRRINWALATLSIVLRGLDRIVDETAPPRTILELGAGDGSLMLRIAKHRKKRWPNVAVTLLDRQNVVNALTLAGIRATGWEPEVLTIDVDQWLTENDGRHFDLVVANLFIHHFDEATLKRLFAGIAQRSRAFFCCDPRRSQLGRVASHFVALLGAGQVARFDAVASVHAGFRGNELTALWPDRADWIVSDYDAWLFSHCFRAVRKTDARQ